MNITEIHGLVKGWQNGEMGGSLVFASSRGFLIGSTGSIEANRLVLTTPTDAFMDKFLDEHQDPVDTDINPVVQQMLDADVPIAEMSEITIEGSLEARDSLLLHGRNLAVNSGAKLRVLEGEDGHHQQLFESLVNTHGVLNATALEETDGGALALVAQGGDINIGVNTQLFAEDAGLVITAIDQDLQPEESEGQDFEDFFKPERVANSNITLAGELKAKDIQVVAAAHSLANWTLGASLADLDEQYLENTLESLKDKLEDQMDVDLPQVDLAISRAEANAELLIKDTAEITATGDAQLQAKAKREAIAEVDVEDANYLGAAAAIGSLAGETLLEVEEGASIQVASGQLSLEALSDNQLTVSAESHASNEKVSLAGTLALGFVDVDTRVDVHSAANAGIEAQNLYIQAHNENTYKITAQAKSSSDEGLSVGVAVAMGFLDSRSELKLAGSFEVADSATLAAFNITETLHNQAKTKVGPDDSNANSSSQNNGSASEEGAVSEWANTKIEGASEDIENNGGQQQASPAQGQGGGLPLKAGGAIAFLRSREDADLVTEDATLFTGDLGDPLSENATVNQLALIARREVGELRNHAVSEVVSKGKGQDENGSSMDVSLSAAIALGFVEGQAKITLGEASQINAEQLGLAAQVDFQPEDSWGDDGFSKIGDFQPDEDEEAPTDKLTQYAGSEVEGSGSGVDISGSVSYLNLDNNAEVEIGEEVHLQAQFADEDQDWETEIKRGDFEHSWSSALAVQSLAAAKSVELAGTSSKTGKVGLGGAVNWSQRSSHSSIEVAADARLHSASDLLLAAQRDDRQVVLTPFVGEGAGDDALATLGAAVAYGYLEGQAQVTVLPQAELIADEALQLNALAKTNLQTLTLSQLKKGGTLALGATVAFSDVDAETRVDIETGDQPLRGGSIWIASQHQGEYVTEAEAKTQAQMGLGAAVAVADIDTVTLAELQGEAETDGEFILTADSLTSKQELKATTKVEAASKKEDKKDEEDKKDAAGEDGKTSEDSTQATEFAGKKLNDSDTKLNSDVADSGDGSSSTLDGFNLRLAAAGTVLLSDETAEARLLEGSQISGWNQNEASQVVVLAQRHQEGLVTRAKSATVAKVKKDENAFSASAAVSFSQLNNDALARIEADSEISTQYLGLASKVEVSDNFRLPNQEDVPEWQGLDNLKTFAKEAKENGEELVESWMTTYATSTTESKNATFDAAGAVNYLGIQSTSEAWVDEGVILNISQDASSGSDWTTDLERLDRKDDEADPWEWQAGLSVLGLSKTSTIDLAGNIDGITGFGVDAGDGTAAVGGAFAWSERQHQTLAGLAEGVVVNATDASVDVASRAEDQAITLAPSAGKGADYALNGAVAVTRTQTYASVSHATELDAYQLNIDAEQKLVAWSVSGAVSQGDNLGIGAGVAVNDLQTDTLALLGDNRQLRLNPLDDDDPLAAAEQRLTYLNLNALTEGVTGAAAVAGAKAGEKKSDKKNASSKATEGFDERAKGVQETARDESVDGHLDEPAERLEEEKNASDEGASTASSSSSGSNDSNTNFGLAISGSAAVTFSDMNTQAVVDGAEDLAAQDADNGVQIHLDALNETDQLALSGAGALVQGSDDSSFDVGIAGALAINYLENETRAEILNSELTQLAAQDDEAAVRVSAVNAGELISVGLGLSVVTGGNDTSAAIAGSVSLASLQNSAKARIENTQLKVLEPADPDAEVTAPLQQVAYDRSRIANGGGALTFGGRVGIGVAVTYSEIENTTLAEIAGSDLQGFTALDMGAYTASRIISAAAAMQASTGDSQGVDFAGSVTINRISNQVMARVQDSNLEIAGDVQVKVASVSGDGPELLQQINAGQADQNSSRHDINWTGEGTAVEGKEEGDGQAAGSEHEDADEIDQEYADITEDAEVGGLLDGEAILGIAGGIQFGQEQNAIGLSFAGNFITSDYLAEIRDSEVTAEAVSVETRQSTHILGIAAGAAVTGGKLAGLGSGVFNSIGFGSDDNSIHASVVDSQLFTDHLEVLAGNSSNIYAAAGNVAYSSKAALGAAIGYNAIGTETRAWTEGLQLQNQDGNGQADLLDMQAYSSGRIYGLAVSGGISQGLALNGSVNINRLQQEVTAELLEGDDELQVEQLKVGAGNADGDAAASVWTLTGALSAGKKAAFGVGFAWNEIDNQYTARIKDSHLTSVTSADLSAASSGEIRTLAGAGGMGGTVAMTGAAAYSLINAKTQALMQNSSLLGPDAELAISAQDSSDIISIAASLAASKQAAGAAALSVNEIGSEVRAGLYGHHADAGKTFDGQQLTVDADTENSIYTFSAGAAGSGAAAIAGSSAVNLIESQAIAGIYDGAVIEASGDVRVQAVSSDEVLLVSGSLGIGGKALGAAGTVAVNQLQGETRAEIQGAATQVSAQGTAEGLSVINGDLIGGRGVIDYDNPEEDSDQDDPNEEQLSEDYAAARLEAGTEQRSGLAVGAGSHQSVGSYIATAGISLNPKFGVGVAGAVNVNTVDRRTRALIEEAQVNQATGLDAGDVWVQAAGHTETRSLAVGAAFGSVGVAGAMTTDVISQDVAALISDAEVAAQDVRVLANVSQTASGQAYGGAGGTWAAGAAGGVLIIQESESLAEISGSEITSDNLLVDAFTFNALSMTSANAAVSGGVGMAGSFTVGLLETKNNARVVDSEVSVADTAEVLSQTDNEIFSVAASFAGGGLAGVAGMVSAIVVASDTGASVEDSQIEDPSADGRTELIRVKAEDSLAIQSAGGGAALGGQLAAAASASIISAQSQVSAQVKDSDFNASKVEVLADRKADLESMTLTLSGSTQGVALSGGIGVLLLGGGVDDLETVQDEGAEHDEDTDADSNRISVQQELTGGEDGENGGTLSALNGFGQGTIKSKEDDNLGLDDEDAVNERTERDIGERIQNGGEHATQASIVGGSITTDELNLDAQERNRSINIAGAGAAGLGGLGGAVTVTLVNSEVLTQLDSTVTLTGSDAVLNQQAVVGRLTSSLHNTSFYNLNNYDDLDDEIKDDLHAVGDPSALSLAVAGGVGAVGAGAAYADARVTSRIASELGGEVLTEESDATVQLTAQDFSEASAFGVGAGLGAAAGGLVVGHAAKDSQVLTQLLDQTELSDLASLELDSEAGGRAFARGIAAAGGIVSGSGAVILASDQTQAQSFLGQGVALSQVDNISLNALAQPAATAEAYAVSLGGVAVGVSFAQATAASLALAEALDDIQVNEGNLELKAEVKPFSGYSAEAISTAAGGGYFLSAQGGIARAVDTTHAKTQVGDAFQLDEGDLTLISKARPAAYAEGKGYSGSVVTAFGGALAFSEAQAEAEAKTGDDLILTGSGQLQLLSEITPGTNYSAYSKATAATMGGLVGASGAWAESHSQSQSRALVGDHLRMSKGDLEVRALNTSHQHAEGLSVSIGGVALGLVHAEATSETSTLAQLGEGLSSEDDRDGAIRVQALGKNRDTAESEAGSGGLVAGEVSSVHTDSQGEAVVDFGGHSEGWVYADQVAIQADQQNIFTAKADSTRASLAGMSGARMTLDSQASSQVNLGDELQLRARAIDVEATTLNQTESEIKVGSGGVLNASAAQVRAGSFQSPIQGAAEINLGDAALLETTGDHLEDQAGEDIRFHAYNEMDLLLKGRLNTGGAIDIPIVELAAWADVKADITLGQNSEVLASRDVAMVAYSDSEVLTDANVRTHGAAGAASAHTFSMAQVNSQLTLAGQLESGGDLLLAAGLDENRTKGEANTSAESYIWNKTVIPVETDPTAEAHHGSVNKINIKEDAEIVAGRDASLMTAWGNYEALGEGIGKDLYRKALEEVTNTLIRIITFGRVKEAVTLEIHTGEASLNHEDEIRVDGEVIAGANSYQYLWISEDEDGNPLVESSPGVEFEHDDSYELVKDLLDEKAEYEDLIEQYFDEKDSRIYRIYAQLETVKARLADFIREETLDEGDVAAFIADLEAEGSEVVTEEDLEGDQVRVSYYDATITTDRFELEDITASSGDLLLHSSKVTGSGSLSIGDQRMGERLSEASQATQNILMPDSSLSVRVLNETNSILDVNNITIEGTQGRVIQHFPSPINNFAAPSTGERLASQGFSMARDITGWDALGSIQIDAGSSSSTPPEINLINNWSQAGGVDDEEVLPEIRLLEDRRIYNPNGSVTISAGNGSVISSGQIIAANVNIVAGVRFVQNYIDGIWNVAGNNEEGSYDPEERSQIVAGSEVFVNAEYINVNGLIQAGVSEYSLTITQELIDEVLEANKNAAGELEDEEIRLSGYDEDGVRLLNEIESYFNVEEEKLTINPSRIRAGRIFLAGDIVSTGGGELKAASGYGNITIDNQTDYDLQVFNQNAGYFDEDPSEMNGLIEIIDFGYELSHEDELPDGIWEQYQDIPSPRITRYTHDWQTNEILKERALLGAYEEENQVFVEEVSLGSLDSIAGKEAQYKPVEGRKIQFGTGSDPDTVVDSGDHLKADRPIKITFSGFQEALVQVDSLGDIFLQGELSNRDGLVQVTSHQGGIYGPSETGGISAADIQLRSRLGMGTESAPVKVTVVDPFMDSQERGGLDAVARAGDLFFSSPHEGQTLYLTQVETGYGDVVIGAYDSIFMQDKVADGEAAIIKGRNLELTSAEGQIGRDNQLLRIHTGHLVESLPEDIEEYLDLGEDWAEGQLSEGSDKGSASLSSLAFSGIHLQEVLGDLQVDLVYAEDGDVTLDVPQGNLLSVHGRGDLDAQQVERLRGIWEDMGLLGEDAEAFAEQAVEDRRDHLDGLYEDYWMLNELLEAEGERQEQLFAIYQTRFLNDRYTDLAESRLGDALNPDDHELAYSDDANMDVLLARAALEKLYIEQEFVKDLELDELSDLAAFQEYDGDWQVELPETTQAALREGAVWTEDELLTSISRDALLETDSTLYQQLEVNIAGNQVKLSAQNIGEFADPVRIEIFDQDLPEDEWQALTDEQFLALLTAQPGDINFEFDGGYFSPEGDVIGNLKALVVDLTSPLVLAHGDQVETLGVHAFSQGHLFFASPSSLELHDIQAADDIRIQVLDGNITASDYSQTVINRDAPGLTANLLLEAGGGRIGSSSGDALRVNLDVDAWLTARAAEGLAINQVGGDLRLDRANTLDGLLFLAAEQGSIVTRDDDAMDLQARYIQLEAAGDITGQNAYTQTAALNLEHFEGGWVSARAGGQVRLANFDGNLSLNEIESGEETFIQAWTDIQVNQVISGGEGSGALVLWCWMRCMAAFKPTLIRMTFT